MATLVENAAAVKAAQVAIDAAIVAKGGTTAGGLSNAAAAINAMNYNYDADEWVPPLNWPNIRKILADDVGPVQYPKKVIYFFERGLNLQVELTGAKYYKLSTGETYSSNTLLKDNTLPDEDFWVICYTDETAFTGVPYNPVGGSDYNRGGPSWVVYDGDAEQILTTSTAGKSFYAMGFMKSLENLIANLTSEYAITSGCDSLENVSNFKFSESTSAYTNLPTGFSSSTVYTKIKFMSGDGYAHHKITSFSNAASWQNAKYNSLVKMPTNLKVTVDGVSGASQFAYCGNLKQLPDFSEAIITNGDQMFSCCVNLPTAPNLDLSQCTKCNAMFRACSKIVNFPVYDLSVCTDTETMFECCSSAKSIKLSHVNGALGNRMFRFCNSLESVDLPSETSSLGTNMFSCCVSMKTLIVRATTPPTCASSTSISELPSDTKIYVPYGCSAAYKDAPTWISRAAYIYELDRSGNIPEEV